MFRISDFGFPASAPDGLRRGERNCRSVLPLALLVASWQFAAAAQAAIIAPDGAAYSLATTSSSIDRIHCITSENQEKQPSQDGNDFPDSATDLDDTDGGLDDLSAGADTSTRNDQDTPLFSVTGLDAGTLRRPRIVPILLFPVPSFYCLHEHIRERAPPTLS